MSLTKITLISILGAGLVWLMVDCCGGNNQHLECVITGHRYTPAWVETHFSTDSDGNTSFSQIQHPEIYELTATDLLNHKPLDISTEPYRYNRTTNGTIVTVLVRIGRAADRKARNAPDAQKLRTMAETIRGMAGGLSNKVFNAQVDHQLTTLANWLLNTAESL